MKFTQIFPATIVLLSLISAVVCFKAGDWKRGMYWTGATIIAVAVML